MIKRRYIFIPLAVLSIGVLVVAALLYVLFLRRANDREMVFPASEVGIPTGPPVSKTVGPEGGSISSPDGKITVKVPMNAVAGNTQFSIQPITNMAKNGIGNGYRLEPGDRAFAVPLNLTIHFDDRDLEGTVGEALQLAYQDKDGSWHAQASTKLNDHEKTLTIATTHFSDWLVLRTIGISPVKATLLLGETVGIGVDSCPDRDPIQKYNIWKYVFGHDCRDISGTGKWRLAGAGELSTNVTDGSGKKTSTYVFYTAPHVKPADPVAVVTVDIDVTIRDPDTGEVKTYPRTFESRIKIVDRGYKAVGNTGDAQYSGVVCLDSPFTVNADVKIINFALDFTPGSDTGGTWKMSGSMPFLRGSGSGSYTFEDGTSEHPPRLALMGTSTGTIPVASRTKAADTYISLIPNDGDECLRKGGQ